MQLLRKIKKLINFTLEVVNIIKYKTKFLMKVSHYHKFKTIINCNFGFYNFKIYS